MERKLKSSFLALVCTAFISNADAAALSTCRYFLNPSIPFQKGSKLISTADSFDPGMFQKEEGELSGHPYTLDYFDGHLVVGTFEVTCGVDPIDDHRWCVAYAGDLTISKAAGHGLFVQVGKKHYPGTSVVVRVDKSAPIVSKAPGWANAEAEKVLVSIRKGQTITTRYQEWPYTTNIDKTVPIDALPAVLSFFNFALPQKGRPCIK